MMDSGAALMSLSTLHLVAAYPEILLLILTCVILLLDLFVPGPQRLFTYIASLLSLALIAALSTIYLLDDVTGYAFNGMFVSDPLAHLLKVCAYIAVGLTFIYGRKYIQDRNMLAGGEFYVLGLFSLLGQMIMISANSLLVIYLGLELLSLSLYALVALRRDDFIATEAAMKYFVLGALASGFMLYGMSMIYGATASLDLSMIARVIQTGQANHLLLTFGLVFLVAGLAFKLGAAPFHMWVPDVYQGAPTAVTLLVAAGPKLAAFAITLRLLAEGLINLSADWQPMLAVLAISSLAIGNITAIAQNNLKRMLAYSAISHMGYLLLGILSGVALGNAVSATSAYSAALFYIITYVLTTLCSFGVILVLAKQGFEAQNIQDLKGLNRRSPWLALVMLLCMLSLAGLPPLVGFQAKLSILQALIEAQHLGLAITALFFSLIGAFYYLRIIKVMYFDEADTNSQNSVDANQGYTAENSNKTINSALPSSPVLAPDLHGFNDVARGLPTLLSMNGLLILALGLLPGPLMSLCIRALARTLSI